MSKKVVNTFATLPPKLIEDFEEINFSKIERNYALKFIDNLMKRSFREHGMIDGFVETPKNYFRKAFNSQYLIWLNKLIDKKIILSNHSYSNSISNTYSKSYSLNSTYTASPIMWLTFEENPMKSIPYTFKIAVESNEEKLNFEKVIEDLNRIKTDRKVLMKIASDTIEKIKIEDFKTNENISRDAFNVTFGTGKKYWMTKEKAIQKSIALNKLLIQDDSNFYIIDEYEFILRKKTSVLQSYQDAIDKLINKKFYGKRNTTNNRLDTNLTNMAKILTNEICENNNFIQFDLCNAQFAILSDYLENILHTDDFEIFKTYSYDGTLYDYIKEKLGLENRTEAKKMMFELMFSKEDYQSSLKTKLKEIFPSVVAIVDKYKKEHGYNNFSIMLQKKESEIFIDGIWKQLKKRKIFCTPKHDCLIVKEKDAEKVNDLIREHFEKINFKGKIVRE
jgi:hypothetical protein